MSDPPSPYRGCTDDGCRDEVVLLCTVVFCSFGALPMIAMAGHMFREIAVPGWRLEFWGVPVTATITNAVTKEYSDETIHYVDVVFRTDDMPPDRCIIGKRKECPASKFAGSGETIIMTVLPYSPRVAEVAHGSSRVLFWFNTVLFVVMALPPVFGWSWCIYVMATSLAILRVGHPWLVVGFVVLVQVPMAYCLWFYMAGPEFEYQEVDMAQPILITKELNGLDPESDASTVDLALHDGDDEHDGSDSYSEYMIRRIHDRYPSPFPTQHFDHYLAR